MTSPSIRDSTLADLAAVRAVYRRSSLSNTNDRGSLLAHPVLEWPAESITSGRTRVAVDADGAVIAFATVSEGRDGLELEDLFVDPDRMRAGVGAQLVRDAAEAATRAGRAWIDVTANPHAAAFYAAVGFIPTGVEQTTFGPAARLRLHVSPQN